MNFKTIEEKRNYLMIVTIGLQVLTIFFSFLDGAIIRLGKASSMIFASGGTSKKVGFSLLGISQSHWNVDGDPPINYDGAEVWFFLFLILTVISICCGIYEFNKKQNIIPIKINALIVTGIELYAIIFCIVLGNLHFKTIDRGGSYYLMSKKKTIDTTLGATGYIFIVLCLCIIAIKIYEFFTTLKENKADKVSLEEHDDTRKDSYDGTVNNNSENQDIKADEFMNIKNNNDMGKG